MGGAIELVWAALTRLSRKTHIESFGEGRARNWASGEMLSSKPVRGRILKENLAVGKNKRNAAIL